MTPPSNDPTPPQLAVLSASDQDWQQIIDYMAGEATPADRLAVEQRLRTDPAFATLAATVAPVWRTPLPVPTRDLDAGWAAIQQKAAARRTAAAITPIAPQHPTPAPTRHTPRHRWTSPRRWLAIAATILVAVAGVRVLHQQLSPTYYYRGGTTATAITLPDSSHVILAPGSYLGTEHGFPTHTRTVYLFGQAQFTVAPNPRIPFIVTVPGVGARVLGTIFTMDADTTASIRVNVTTGAVAMEHTDSLGNWHPLQILKAGDAAQIPRMETWLAQAGYALNAAGVPFFQAMHLGTVLRTAVIRLGASAANH
jgi:ferric-dicitrate binding protein FerR (iron transport regulator)